MWLSLKNRDLSIIVRGGVGLTYQYLIGHYGHNLFHTWDTQHDFKAMINSFIMAASNIFSAE